MTLALAGVIEYAGAMTRRLALLALGLCGCATPGRPVTAAPAGAARYGDAVDSNAAGEEAAELLRGYLQVETVNPPGNETLGARYLAAALQRDGIDSEIVEFAPGRGSLIARLPATGAPTEKPLCLVSHIDVVPAEAQHWPADKQPFAGVVDAEGTIWGRGALDMKGMGAIELAALVLLKRGGVPLTRDVILLALADEEVASEGAKLIAKDHWQKLGCGTLINEGGYGLKDLLQPGQTAFATAVGEKGVLWLKLTAFGEAGHGSVPMADRAPSRLLEALEAITSRKLEPKIPAALYEMLRRAGANKGGFNGFVMQRPALVDAFVTPRLMASPRTRAGITDTCQVTGFEGRGSAPNVVPSAVSAFIDCRLLPGTAPGELLHQLQSRTQHLGVELEVVLSRASNESPWDDPFFDALERHATTGRTDAVAGPIISVGFTDSQLLRPLGTRAYGLVPFEITTDELGTIHGRNERVSKANVRRGLEILFRAVVDVSAKL